MLNRQENRKILSQTCFQALASLLLIVSIVPAASPQTLIRNASIVNATISGGGVPFLVSSTSGLPVGSGPYTLTIPATGSGHLIIVGVDSFPSTNSISVMTDNAPGGGNSYISAGVKGTDVNGGISEIWYVASTKSGATTITVNTTANSSPTCGYWKWPI